MHHHHSVYRYHPREQQFRLCALLESCETKPGGWLDEYVDRIQRHEAKTTTDESLIGKLLLKKGSLCVEQVPDALKRNGDKVDIAMANRNVIEAIRCVIDYDGRLRKSRDIQGLRAAASRDADVHATDATGTNDIGSSLTAGASSSAVVMTLSIRDDLTLQ